MDGPGTPGPDLGATAPNLAHKSLLSPSTPAAHTCPGPHGPPGPAAQPAAPAHAGLAAGAPPGHTAVPACLQPARAGLRAAGCAAGRPRVVRCSRGLRVHARPPGHAGRTGFSPSTAPGGPATVAPAVAAARPDTTAQLRATLPAALLRPPRRPGLYPLPGLRAAVDMRVPWLGPQGAGEELARGVRPPSFTCIPGASPSLLSPALGWGLGARGHVEVPITV